MKAKSLLLAGGVLLGSTPLASASGFQVNLQGQKNIGMGGVGVGLALDHAAMFYNPGALAMVRGNGVQLGVNAALARNSFRSETGTGDQRQLDNTLVTPANFYAAFGPKEGKWKIGIGAYTPFGSELHYADNWEGRYTLTDINLRAIFAQVTASYAITPQLSVGAGLVMLAYGDVDLQRDVPLAAQNGANSHVTLNGKAERTFGYNAGIYFKPSDKLSVGVSYRSQVDAKIKGGDVRLRDIPNGAISNFTATAFDATLPLPATASIGIGVMPNEKLTIGLDANLVMWSAYRTLDFTFSGNNGYGGAAGRPGLVGGNTTSSSKRYYQDALCFRLGGQYKVNDNVALRLGTFYDFSAVRDGYVTPETPDADRIGATAGATFSIKDRFGIDLSFLFEDFLKRSQTQADLLNNGTTDRVAGTYKTTIAIPGVGLFVKF